MMFNTVRKENSAPGTADGDMEELFLIAISLTIWKQVEEKTIAPNVLTKHSA